MTIYLCRPDGVKFRRFVAKGSSWLIEPIEGIPPGQFDNGCCRDFCHAADYLMREKAVKCLTVNGYIILKEK